MIFSSAPLIVKITKKASEGTTLKRSIEQAGGKFIPTHTFWYMGSIDGRYCDFHVVFDGRLISVKVISLLSRGVMIRFIDKDSYGIKVVKSFDTVEEQSVSYKTKRKKPYDFKKGLKEPERSLPQAKIIMSNLPEPLMLSVMENGVPKRILCTDMTPEGEYYTSQSFIELFK